MLERPERRTVRQTAQAQLQSSLQQQQGTSGSPLPRLLAQEQEGVQGRAHQVHRGDARTRGRVLHHHGSGAVIVYFIFYRFYRGNDETIDFNGFKWIR